MGRPLSSIPIHPLKFAQAIDTLAEWARGSTPRYVSTCTVYTLMRGLEDEQIAEALNAADLVTADGMPLVWLQHLRGDRFAERVYGPDLTLALLERLNGDPNVSHFFLGGLEGVPALLVQSLKARYPELAIAGAFSPPVAAVGDVPDPSLAERVNASGASVVWVGLGSPKQDLWMHLYRPVLNAPLLIGIGAAFDFLSGTKSQAPKWMQKRGLEWLFRLYQEPRRLGKRYLVYNAKFVAAVIKNRLRK
jgi:N-acetylglucosaminyldiphosphoundecaprenol N-acetyl-beta-D-mannosaminyltransferase